MGGKVEGLFLGEEQVKGPPTSGEDVMVFMYVRTPYKKCIFAKKNLLEAIEAS